MDDLALIKKYYGESMMKYCRKNFSSILEEPGKLFNILDTHFQRSTFLYEDIKNIGEYFKNYILNLASPKRNLEVITSKTPFELLEEAGYTLYECKTEEDIQKFRNYFEPDEELCSFKENRLKDCYVFFALKKDVDKIKRSDFHNPERQDSYGTSVISIQFTRGTVNTVSIKNRYNHRVKNPDATFSNNLDMIIPGLAYSFKKYYHLIFSSNNSNFELNKYVKANDGKYYKYNYERFNIYYCPNNLIIENFNVNKKFMNDNSARYFVIDNFIFDTKEKTIKSYEPFGSDSFLDFFKENKIKLIEKRKNSSNSTIIVTMEDDKKVYITVDKYNRIIEYKNDYITKIGDNFMKYNDSLTKLDIPNVEEIGSNFLYSNISLTELNFNKLKKIADGCLKNNNVIVKINAPSLEYIGDDFMISAKARKIDLPSVKVIGNSFMRSNELLCEFKADNLVSVGRFFLYKNLSMEDINLPNLQYTKNDFMSANKIMKKALLPSLILTGINFLESNDSMEEINISNLHNDVRTKIERRLRKNRNKRNNKFKDIQVKLFNIVLLKNIRDSKEKEKKLVLTEKK